MHCIYYPLSLFSHLSSDNYFLPMSFHFAWYAWITQPCAISSHSSKESFQKILSNPTTAPAIAIIVLASTIRPYIEFELLDWQFIATSLILVSSDIVALMELQSILRSEEIDKWFKKLQVGKLNTIHQESDFREGKAKWLGNFAAAYWIPWYIAD